MIEKVLALYDFASKQEYIYRTSKIKEITGASMLLAGFYNAFVEILSKGGIKLKYDLSSKFSVAAFDNNDKIHGEVLYDGGGNLMVLWKSEKEYKKANELISVFLLKNAPSLSIIASQVPFTGVFDDKTEGEKSIVGDRTKLYQANAARKNLFPAFDMPAVMPFTQVDSATFLPVTYKRSRDAKGSVYPAADCSLSSDRYAKAERYRKRYGVSADFFDKDGEGMFAVIYIDGNSMGNKLMACRSQDYDEGVAKLRSFAQQVNSYFVDAPIKAIEEKQYTFRQVIGGGDEITLICPAKNAFEIMKTYFDDLGKPGKEFDCTSCAGVSVFHAKSPFNVAYDIAQAACEEAKKKAHKEDGNYFCFYYCHSGVTNTFDRLHAAEQKHASGKPYKTADLARIEKYAEMLNAAGRSNVKALGSAAQRGLIDYQFEVQRVNAYLEKGTPKFEGDEKEMNLVYDMSEFYDLWFAKEENNNDQNT